MKIKPHHKTYLIPIFLILAGLIAGGSFMVYRSTVVKPIVVQKVQSLQKGPYIINEVNISNKAEEFNKNVDEFKDMIGPSLSVLSMLGGFVLLIINLVKALRKPATVPVPEPEPKPTKTRTSYPKKPAKK